MVKKKIEDFSDLPVEEILAKAKIKEEEIYAKAEIFLLQNYPEIVRQNYWLNMQIAARIYQEQDKENLLNWIKLVSVLENESCFYLEKHFYRAEIFTALRKEKEWEILFSVLHNSFQHDLENEQLLEMVNYLNELLVLSKHQKASLTLQKDGQTLEYSSRIFRDILAEETAHSAALALIKLLNSPGGTNIWLEHPEIWQTSELSEALLEALAVRPTSLAVWLKANQETKVFPACLTREGQRIWPDILNRAKQALQFDQKILQANSKIQ